MNNSNNIDQVGIAATWRNLPCGYHALTFEVNFHLLVSRQHGIAVDGGRGAIQHPSHDQEWARKMSEYYRPDQLKKFAEIGEGNQELADKFFS